MVFSRRQRGRWNPRILNMASPESDDCDARDAQESPSRTLPIQHQTRWISQSQSGCKWRKTTPRHFHRHYQPASQLQLRIHLAIIAHRQYHCVQMDLTNAYLHANIQDVVFIIIPQGFLGAGEVALLEKGLYGTKQGSRRFFDPENTQQVG